MLTYVSNTCVGSHVFHRFNVEYKNSRIASLFVKDVDYLTFCKEFDLLGCTPFKANLEKAYCPQSFIDHIELHWIHDTDIEVVREKYTRHLARMKALNPTPIMLWAEPELFQEHISRDRQELIEEFLNIPYRSIFLSQDINCENLY